MSTVTYTQVQELVRHVPPAKLNRVYGMILKITEKPENVEISPVDFMKLPISERRKLMKNQARTMAAHYKKTANERRDWQEGNFIDES